MNIFWIGTTDRECAQYLCDQHLNKMILETAQILCTAHHKYPILPFDDRYKRLYKSTHANHPCSLWARRRRGNYVLLSGLFYEYCKEYRYRKGKSHSCYKLWDLLHIPPDIPDSSPYYTPPSICVNTETFITNDTLLSYRRYYKYKLDSWLKRDKPIIAQWTGRPLPYWLDAKTLDEVQTLSVNDILDLSYDKFFVK